MPGSDFQAPDARAGADTAEAARPLPPNVVRLPRRLRDFPFWAALLASYEATPPAPGKVLPFAPPRGPVTRPRSRDTRHARAPDGKSITLHAISPRPV